MPKLFGTDGIRGYTKKIGNEDIILSPDFCSRVGYSIALTMPEDEFSIVWDTRASSRHIAFALASALGWMRKKVHLVGVLPTPACSVLARTTGGGAISVSASHNPPEFNGIKIFSSDGLKISQELEEKIEKVFDKLDEKNPIPDDFPVQPEISSHLSQIFISHIKSLFPKNFLKGVEVLLDTANGATYKVAPEIFEHFGAKVKVIGNEPDGKNINVGVGSENPQKALSEDAKFKVIFDGDGDRVLLGDSKGNLFDGDHILSIIARNWAKKGKLSWGVVGTQMSNLALEKFVKSLGYNFERVPVGDRNISYKMKEIGANLGGEESGHVILWDYLPTGDGITTALEVLRILQEEGKELSELAIQKFPQVKRKIKVRKKIPFELDESILKEMEKEGVRAVVRYSGTEPVLRIMTEAEDKEKAERWAEKLEELLREKLSSVVVS